MISSNNTERIDETIEKYIESNPGFGKLLWPKITYMRQMPLKKQKQDQQNRLERFVSISSRPDRLRTGPGTEICLIFRSKGCIWARSDAGGCTMCGYINDKASDNITDEDLWQQFETALRMKHDELITGQTEFIFKIFTSGSFMDPAEFGEELQLRILSKLTEYPAIKEIVVESRPQFITKNRLEQYRKVITTQYFEVGVGLETANDFLRGTVINKGFSWKEFIRAKDELHEFGFGIKAYILFKPPFLSEYAAISDTFTTIRRCITAGVNTISINPTNIQSHTICEELNKNRMFRPPWLFSLIWLLKHAIKPEELSMVRIICDPSAAGKDRGVHNFADSDEDKLLMECIRKFVVTQDPNNLPDIDKHPKIMEYFGNLLFRAI
jgi:radical SAM enzyme (TIGR01210 family)